MKAARRMTAQQYAQYKRPLLATARLFAVVGACCRLSARFSNCLRPGSRHPHPLAHPLACPVQHSTLSANGLTERSVALHESTGIESVLRNNSEQIDTCKDQSRSLWAAEGENLRHATPGLPGLGEKMDSIFVAQTFNRKDRDLLNEIDKILFSHGMQRATGHIPEGRQAGAFCIRSATSSWSTCCTA